MQKSNENDTESYVFCNVTITFKQGNILECQSDILVNPTDQGLSINAGDCLAATIRKMAGK